MDDLMSEAHSRLLALGNWCQLVLARFLIVRGQVPWGLSLKPKSIAVGELLQVPPLIPRGTVAKKRPPGILVFCAHDVHRT